MFKKILVLILVLLVSASMFGDVHAKGGGGRSGGARSSGARSSGSKSVSTGKSASTKTTAAPKVPKPSTRPSATTQTKTTSPKTIGGKTYSGKGSVVDSNYQPKFSGGYSAPAGSVVYYRQNSFLDYLPLWYIMSHDSHKEAVVQTPDGKEQTVKEEGTDGMYVFNWILTILVGLGLIAGIVYLINKFTTRKSYV